MASLPAPTSPSAPGLLWRRLEDDRDPICDGKRYIGTDTKDTEVQLVISMALGLSAFVAFCILRPRWKSLYAARKRHLDPSIGLPSLPDNFFGWMPALYRITDQQVLASAGLDAFVFLNFFKMAIKLFSAMFFFAAVVLQPIHVAFSNKKPPPGSKDPSVSLLYQIARPLFESDGNEEPDISFAKNMGYLWSYLVFTYFFTALTLYILNKETFKVIRVRQDYLGTQSTITDRTFRLSGIPKDLRTEAAIKNLVEKLEIGKVESVTLCQNWKELDDLMDKRGAILAKLEEAWSVYRRQKALPQTRNTSPNANPEQPRADGVRPYTDEEADENGRLLEGASDDFLDDYNRRPQTRFRYGLFRLQSRKTDAIDYYTEKLRALDDKIFAARKRQYEPADLAFVTMDSIAACQMAIQALIDPHPGQLLTRPAPAPSDVVWRNTYASYLSRRTRAWVVTMFVAFLTVVWAIPVAFFASVLSICTIEQYLPSFALWLNEHQIARALVQTGLPTAAVSILNVGVPYLYDYLSNNQGRISQGDVALSVISKNFFFAFFNLFLLFAVFGGVTEILVALRQGLKDSTYLAITLAGKLEHLSKFYINFIMLQGLGLFPFRLLQFGSVTLYPILRMGAKTPRDFAEMFQPPLFYYGLYLPTALLVFILCLVYSVLEEGYQVLGLGVVYFTLGFFTYKYQLLYAMDQPQHATGGAWRIIAHRVMLGLIVFQVTMIGFLALVSAFTIALLIVPLLIGTLWYSYSFKEHFEPLTRFISLRSIKRAEDQGAGAHAILDDDFDEGTGAEQREFLRRSSTVDEDRERGLRFINPNLVAPLAQPWVYQDPPPPLIDSGEEGEGASTPSANEREYTPTTGGVTSGGVGGGGGGGGVRPSAATVGTGGSNSSSSVSLGDTHIWRDA